MKPPTLQLALRALGADKNNIRFITPKNLRHVSYPVKYRMMFRASLLRGGPVDSYLVNELMFYQTFEPLKTPQQIKL